MKTVSGKYPVLGFVVNQLEGRYQSLIHQGLSDFASNSGLNLITFVGRSLDSPYFAESSQNMIYSLARTNVLDGLVITTGSIGNYLPEGGINDFLKSYPPLPMVTIGIANPDIPGIISDNSTGTRELIDHLVTVHHYRRLAFLGGPPHNVAARARHEGFLAAMRFHNLEIQEELLFRGDFSYQSGQKIASDLNVDNGFPFDVLVSANDEMALAFSRTMEQRGFTTPRDYYITGFDDVDDTRFVTPPMTTVHQPLYEQGALSGELLLKLINGDEVPPVSTLPCSLVLRESCGCPRIPRLRNNFTPHGGPHENPSTPADLSRQATITAILKGIYLPEYKKDRISEALPILLDTVMLDIRTFREQSLFLMTLQEWFEITEYWDNVTKTWNQILNGLHNELLKNGTDIRTRSYLEDLFRNAFAMLSYKAVMIAAKDHAGIMSILSSFRTFSGGILASGSLSGITVATGIFSRMIGFKTVILCLHKEKVQLPSFGNRTTGYGEMIAVDVMNGDREMLFSGTDILPPELMTHTEPLKLVCMPLVSTEQSFGYLAMEGNSLDRLVFDSLRDIVSQALTVLDQNQRRAAAEESLRNTLIRLKRSEEQFRDMARAVPMTIIETDTNLNIRYINQAGSDGLGIAVGSEPHCLINHIFEKDRHLAEALVSGLKNNRTLDYPGIRLTEKSGNHFLPIVQISGIFEDTGEALTGIRWHALTLLPFLYGEIMPGKDFFRDKNISPREQEVIIRLLQGLRIKDIADNLCIAESTAKGHLTQIYEKLGISNRGDLLDLLQQEQVERYGYNTYLFSLMNKLLSINDE